MLPGFSKKFSGKDHFYCSFWFAVANSYASVLVCSKLWENLFSSSPGWLLLKNVKQTSTSFKEKLSKAGRFSSRDEAKYANLLSRLCRDTA